MVFWGWWRVSRTIIRARACVYCSRIQGRGGILRISRFALKIAGFIRYIIVLNTNFALASSLIPRLFRY